jgi:hypothetical protein
LNCCDEDSVIWEATIMLFPAEARAVIVMKSAASPDLVEHQ